MEELQIFTDQQESEVVSDAEKEASSTTKVPSTDASRTDFSDTNTVQNTPIATTEPTQEQDGLTEQDKKDIAEQVQDVLQNQEETEPDAEYSIDDIYALLSDYCKKQDTYQKEVLENQEFYMEQSKNLLAVSSAILLSIGILSGILLARIVWRKL